MRWLAACFGWEWVTVKNGNCWSMLMFPSAVGGTRIVRRWREQRMEAKNEEIWDNAALG